MAGGPRFVLQGRVEASSRRKSANDVLAASPYAAGGGGSSSGGGGGNSSSSNSNAAWKHKHTKTLPWSEEGAVGGESGGGGGGGGGDGGERGGDGGGNGALDVNPDDEAFGGGITLGAKAREGYRLQVEGYRCRMEPRA